MLLADRHHPGVSRIRRRRIGDPRESENDPAGVDRSLSYQPNVQEETGRNHQCPGLCLRKKARLSDAGRCFEDVQQICQSLLAEIGDGTKPVRLLDLLAIAQFNMAIIHAENKQFDKALELFEKSLEHRVALSRPIRR